MFSKFFIERPIFASVISIIIVLAGLVSIETLPIEEYPEVVPPQVQVTANYPGASADTLAQTVGAPLEQEINGVDNMIYISSTATSTGEMNLNVYFEIGTDPDQATIDVNNRVQAALSKLPEEVQRQGVTARKKSSSIVEVLSIYSPDSSQTPLYISNYALINVVDDLKRIKGVGDIVLFGGKDYSIRVWLKPDRLAKHSLTPNDVIAAIKEQNSQFATGQFGQEPIANKPMFTYTITTKGRMVDAEEFGNIILRADKNGATLRLKEVATVELGAKSYTFDATMDGKPAVPIGVFLQPGANALETVGLVNAEMDRLAEKFPSGMSYAIPYNTTKFVQISIQEVIKTFVEAMALVALIVYLFLQNLRTTIIPLLAVPVSIIGTFAGMYALGFSINLLTLFGLILAIGIVVDDAIIVIENVERIHRTEGLPIKEATIKAMQEVTSPVISIVLVLAAVFIPVSFMGGFTGQMYKQFAMTIVVSVTISGFVALTLTPALCTVFLKEHDSKPFWFVRKFNEFFDFSTRIFTQGVRLVLKYVAISLLLVVGIIYVAFDLFSRVPSSLVPTEDKGVLFILSYLPSASALHRTVDVRDTISGVLGQNPNVSHVIAFAGMDLISFARKPDAGVAFVELTDWDQRKSPAQHSQNLASQFTGMFYPNKEAFILAVNPPPIMGLSVTGGFEMYVQDRTGTGYGELNKYVNQIVAKANQRPELVMVRSTLDMNVPQYSVVLDREKAKSLGIGVSEVFGAMQATFGSVYVNDFNLYGRTYQVNIQSEGDYRAGPEKLSEVFVRSSSGQMIPLSSLLTFERTLGADVVDRFNLFPAAKVLGEPKPGYTSGDALRAIEEVTKEVLPEGYTIAWSGSSYQEKEMGGTGMQAFIFALIFVFLILAAQYERWLMPLAVITAVPFAVFGAISATWLRGLSNDVYFQIGLVMLIGLSAKNAILIVEFAMQKREEGLSIVEASLEAARLRFRPIVMTSLAFTIGVIPLAISSGAGAASRHAIGTGVIGGMVAATTIAIFFVPLFYTLLERLNERFRGSKKEGVTHGA